MSGNKYRPDNDAIYLLNLQSKLEDNLSDLEYRLEIFMDQLKSERSFVDRLRRGTPSPEVGSLEDHWAALSDRVKSDLMMVDEAKRDIVSLLNEIRGKAEQEVPAIQLCEVDGCEEPITTILVSEEYHAKNPLADRNNMEGKRVCDKHWLEAVGPGILNKEKTKSIDWEEPNLY